MDSLFYDVAGSSQLLGPGFGQTSIKAAMRDGALPYKKIGKRVSIARSDLIALAEAARCAPKADGRPRGEAGQFIKKPRPAKRKAR
jgi:hypothetical protein